MDLDTLLFLKLYDLFPHAPFFQFFFLSLSIVGKPFVFLVIACAGFFVSSFRKKIQIQRVFLNAFLGIGIGVGFNQGILKEMIERPRPYVVIPGMTSGDVSAEGFSFASSHAIAAFAFATAIILFQQQKKRTLLSYGIAFLFSYSRIFLGVHYLSDILAGAGIGILTTTFLNTVSVRFLSRGKR